MSKKVLTNFQPYVTIKLQEQKGNSIGGNNHGKLQIWESIV